MNKVTRADRIKATKLAKAYRKKHKISQGGLSIKLDCYQQEVSKLENGVKVPATIVRRALKLLTETNDN